MMTSKIFSTSHYKEIELNVQRLINTQVDLLSSRTMSSPRATGDAIQDLIAENFQEILGKVCKEYSSQFARRAMADLAFKDVDDLYYVIDVKTHRIEAGFHMPNLTSVERLARFYEDDTNHFVILLVDYSINNSQVVAQHVNFVPIEFLSWECLTIGALGWGQIQIANSDRIKVNPYFSRRAWMLNFCDRILDFYPREINKITSRIEHFQKIKEFWQNKSEN